MSMTNLYKKIIIASLLSISCIGAGVYLFTPVKIAQQASQTEIVPFNKDQHSAFIRAMFADKENWDWLIAEGTPFSIDYMLEHQGYPQFTAAKNNLFIDISLSGQTPTGFVAYLHMSSISAKILFLFVDKPFRGQGWGYKLLDQAVKKLYTRYGFKKVRNFGLKNEFVDYVLKTSDVH